MAKKKLDKEAERTSSSPGKIAAIFPLSFSRELPTRVLSTVEIRQTCRQSTIM